MAKPIGNPEDLKRCWAYFAPDKSIQLRSVSPTRKVTRELICKFENVTWQTYEKCGFFLGRVNIKIDVVK